MDRYQPKDIRTGQTGHCGMKEKRDTEFQGGGVVDFGGNEEEE